MSGPQRGYLATYNSLEDKHLVGYFSNIRIRRHLQRSGLISRSGRIIPEKEYQLNAMRRDHQRYVQECPACAIFHKVLDMEYHHQLDIKRKLENSTRKERVQKIKVEHSRRSVEGASPMHFPHPPLGPRNHYGFHPVVAGDSAGPSQLRAPGPVVGYKGGHPPHQYRSKEPASSNMGERSGLRLMNSMEYVTGRSPYQLPVIHRDVMPVPPPPPPKTDRGGTAVRTAVPRGRRFRPTTAPNNIEQPLTKNSGGFPKPSLRSNAFVTMVFLGKSVHLSHDDIDYRDEIKVCQQHCGGENLCVYKGKLLEGETFQFVSRRHHGFPFSLTFFLNGIQVDRLSCCCEYKHQKSSRLGGRHGYFRFLDVEGASPCYRCIIAMSLDKKPSPPKRKMEEDHEEKHVGPWGDEMLSEPSKSSVEQKSSRSSVLVIAPDHEASVESTEEKMETGQEDRKEEKEKLSDRESEDSKEDTGENEYDEDFEADEEVNEEGQTGDQMNGMSKSSSDDKKHNLDYEKESGTSSQKALQASDSEKDESDRCSDSNSKDDKQDERPARSLSSTSTPCSSEDDSRAGAMKGNANGKERWKVSRASDNAAPARDGSENRENNLLRMEENRETLALEKEGIDEAEKAKPEDLTAREDTGLFHENIMAIQHQSPEVNGELEQAGSAESTVGEEGEKKASTRRDEGEESPPVPLESGVVEVEDGSEESPPSEEEGAPDGAFLAEGRRTLDVQKAAEQVVQEGQMFREREALEKEDFATAGGDTHSEEAGQEMARDLLPEEDVVALLQEGQPEVEESAPEESTVAEDDPKGKETGKGVVSPGEQEVLMEGTEIEAALGEQAPKEEELPGLLPGREEDGAVSEGEEVTEEVSKGEDPVEEAVEATGPPVEEVVCEVVSEAEEAVEERGFAVKDDVVGAVSEGEEAVEDVSLAEEGIARVVSPEGEESVEKAISEGEEAVEKPGALLETGDTNVCTGEAMAGGDVFVKPNEFAQLKAPGGEMERGTIGATTSETGQASQVEGSSPLRAGDTAKESVEPDKGPMLQVASGLKALVGAGGDPTSEGSSHLEEPTTEEEGSAEALLGETPSLGSKAKTESAVEECDGGVMGVSAETPRAEPGGGEEAMDGAAAPRELTAGMEGLLECAAERGNERCPVEGPVTGSWLLPPTLRASEAGLVAVAVLGQAGRGAPARELQQEVAVAVDGGVDIGEMVQERVTATGESGMGTEPTPSTPVRGAGGAEPRGSGWAGGEGLCPGSLLPPAAPSTEALGGEDGTQEGTEQVEGEAKGEQPGSPENIGERKGVGVLESAGSALRDMEQQKDSPVGGSPGSPGAADVGERSCRAHEDVVHPNTVVVPLIQPQDGEETHI